MPPSKHNYGNRKILIFVYFFQWKSHCCNLFHRVKGSIYQFIHHGKLSILKWWLKEIAFFRRYNVHVKEWLPLKGMAFTKAAASIKRNGYYWKKWLSCFPLKGMVSTKSDIILYLYCKFFFKIQNNLRSKKISFSNCGKTF